MSLEKEVRSLLGEASAQYKKLDQLVRQGMMSPAALPILHRGLDKMQAGQVLNPQEREAVNKVLQSMLYIVTGDDTVFQKARMHTQRTKYQTEETELEEEEDHISKMEYHERQAQKTTGAEQKKHMEKAKVHRRKAEFAMRGGSAHSYKEETELLDEGDYAIVSSNGPFIGKKSKVHGYVKTMPKGKNLDKLLDKHGADRVIHKDKLKSSNVSEDAELEEKMDLAKADMGDVIKDFRKSDAPQFKGKSEKKKREMAIAAKLSAEREEGMREDTDQVEEGAFKRMVTQDQENKRLGKTTMIANPKTQKVRKVTPSRAKMAVKKGFVYAEEWTDEELDSLFEMDYKEKFAAMLKKTGKSLESMSDEEKKKFFNTVDAAHKAKNEEVELEENTPTDAQLHKTIGPTKNMQQGIEALKKKHGMTHDQAKGHIERLIKQLPIHGNPHKEETVEEGYDDKEEMRAKTQRKLARMSKMKAKSELETDPGVKEETFEEGAKADAMRAMRSDKKGMAPVKKDGGTKTYKGKEAGEERHGGHIVMQLRKAVSIGKPVKFRDGKEHKVSTADAHKFLSKYNSSKPADREKMHSAHNSHDDFQSHINK